jgi:hypothetical protein
MITNWARYEFPKIGHVQRKVLQGQGLKIIYHDLTQRFLTFGLNICNAPGRRCIAHRNGIKPERHALEPVFHTTG